MQSEINIRIGDRSPKSYFSKLTQQCSGEKITLWSITDIRVLKKNLSMNAIPESIFEMEFDGYQQFLEERRQLMAKKIKKYYYSL